MEGFRKISKRVRSNALGKDPKLTVLEFEYICTYVYTHMHMHACMCTNMNMMVHESKRMQKPQAES